LVRDWPEPSDGIDKHRAYALQWFLFSGLSLALAVVIAFRWRID
jgi:cytochrome oxidase assembly protein ShyY1